MTAGRLHHTQADYLGALEGSAVKLEYCDDAMAGGTPTHAALGAAVYDGIERFPVAERPGREVSSCSGRAAGWSGHQETSFMRLAVVTSAVVWVACGGGGIPANFVAAPAGSTCASGLVYQGNAGSPTMNPGLACRSCHLGQNFDNQNPDGLGEPEKAFFFMGTAYASLREDDRCLSANVPSGAKIEILDASGAVKATLPVNEAGNFYSNATSAGFTLPYRARIVANGKTLQMSTPQMDGDCNTCHTDSGRNSAPGRITWPQ